MLKLVDDFTFENTFPPLPRIVFAAAKNALKDASKKYFDGEEIKIDMDLKMKKNILQNVFESFKGYYDDNDDIFTSLTDLTAHIEVGHKIGLPLI